MRLSGVSFRQIAPNREVRGVMRCGSWLVLLKINTSKTITTGRVPNLTGLNYR